MYNTVKDFISDWQLESGLTLKIFSAIPDEKLNIKVNENVRELGLMAWHITQTLTEMGSKAGIVSDDSLENVSVPETIQEICDTYKKYCDMVAEETEKNWTDESLADKVDMYGETWEKKQILNVLVRHQIHHRAQMTVVMRLLDIKVPGIYGPAKEEWAQFGMEPAK